MLEQITYFEIFGLSILVLLGILAFIFLILTALVPILRKKQVWNLPMQYHFIFARITIVFAVLHAFLRIMAYF